MNPKNDFKAFSISHNANVASQEKYEESQNLKTGFEPDGITTHILNKALRQSSTISSVVANFIATQSGNDVLDDGNIEKLNAQLNNALEQKMAPKVPDASLTQKGIVQLTDVVGNSNSLAATQKLVSDVNDNANNKLAKNQNGADIPNKNEFVKNLDLLETVNLAKNAVPNSRRINGKALTEDINLVAGDVGAFSRAEVDERYQKKGPNQWWRKIGAGGDKGSSISLSQDIRGRCIYLRTVSQGIFLPLQMPPIDNILVGTGYGSKGWLVVHSSDAGLRLSIVNQEDCPDITEIYIAD
ncbi:phage tail protein [Photorhabdus hindustanensis]|uniref:phage tail protein n=1 Tax=Photorhabdus hindustanensis TaxID=2918802 RepID=UPI00200117A5|nr:phage tail protein [Photorhabdus hindustanensis]